MNLRNALTPLTFATIALAGCEQPTPPPPSPPPPPRIASSPPPPRPQAEGKRPPAPPSEEDANDIDAIVDEMLKEDGLDR